MLAVVPSELAQGKPRKFETLWTALLDDQVLPIDPLEFVYL